jgi:hypothetical protein
MRSFQFSRSEHRRALEILLEEHISIEDLILRMQQYENRFSEDNWIRHYRQRIIQEYQKSELNNEGHNKKTTTEVRIIY